jgi:hypothetical protein
MSISYATVSVMTGMEMVWRYTLGCLAPIPLKVSVQGEVGVYRAVLSPVSSFIVEGMLVRFWYWASERWVVACRRVTRPAPSALRDAELRHSAVSDDLGRHFQTNRYRVGEPGRRFRDVWSVSESKRVRREDGSPVMSSDKAVLNPI